MENKFELIAPYRLANLIKFDVPVETLYDGNIPPPYGVLFCTSV